ncbi:MAG: UvrD-helicase domain-containing protein [Paucibacter sp.]|nr:UvrD-helicase domain-containing protein [Roseateles sp.]
MSAAAYFVDGRLADSAEFYRVACDPARSVVVEACAGAGKTWMLISRIVRALLAGAAPQEIVAITFTRKAAGEMRERLGEWLAEFAACAADERVAALVQRGMGEAEARAAAPLLAGLHERLLSEGRFVEIRTFHAWFAQLLRAAPLELLMAEGIAPELQLLEDEADLQPDLFKRFHRAVLADAGLHADYLAQIALRGRRVVEDWLLAGFAKRVELRLAAQHGRLIESLPGVESVAPELACHADPVEAFGALRSELAELARELGAAKGVRAQEAARDLQLALECAEAPAAFDSAWAALFTKTGTPKKTLGDSAALRQAQTALERIALAVAQRQAQLEHGRMARLCLALIEQFDAIKSTRGLVDMNDLERGALALLADGAASAWVQQRLDAQVRHLLVDEFQDTSPLQWHALHGWLAGYAGAGGGRGLSVFIVGDPKQSIYRFRRAEPRVFMAARDFVVTGLGGHLLACDHTRRNAAGVLDVVNAAFAAVDGFRTHTTASSVAGGFEAVEVPPSERANAEAREEGWRPSLEVARSEPEFKRRQAEAEHVTHAIAQQLASGVPAGEIFVLARKREALRVLAQSLRHAGIPHVAPEEQALLDAPDVRDLIALLEALASPGHDLALAQALRSPLFGASEDDLLELARAAGSAHWLGVEAVPRRSWWQALHGADAAGRSPALQRAGTLLAAWRDRAGRSSPHDLLDAIVDEGDLLARIAARVPAAECRARLHAVEALLALALDLDGGRYSELYGFVRALKTRALGLVLPSEPDAVQLLTVHGAKGLEADVVFMIDTDAQATRAESATLLVDWPVDAAVPARVAFLASESRPPPALRALLDEERAQREREELNALYVAMTRARRLLVISRTVPARSGNPAGWWSRLRELAQPWSCTAESVSVAAQAAPALPELQRWSAPPRPEAGGAARDEAQARLGEAMHRVLEWVSGTGRAAGPLIDAAAQMYGLDAAQRERLVEAVNAILHSPDCMPYFDAAQLDWAGNEVAIQYQGEDLRIDRLVRRAGTWWVLDYKLGSSPERQDEYLQQMQRYREAVAQLQPGEPVRSALITGTGRLVPVG